MSNDSEVQVQFKAVVGDFERGLQDAARNVKETTTGMTDDVGGLAETITSMGTTAAVLAGVGLAFEGLRRSAEFIAEAVKDTNELADSFEKLGYATGASLEQLNVYTVAMKLSGDQASSLEGLIVGQQRAIKANSETLIANGVAADQAALMSMSFEDYLRRVQEIAENMATPTDRAQFLMLALGRAGAMAGNQLKEFVENLEEAKRLTQDGGIITQKAIDQNNEAEKSVARLETAEQKYAAATAEKANKVANTWRDIKSSLLETGLEQETVNAFLRAGMLDVQALADKYHVSTADMLQDTDTLLKEVHKLREGWIEVAKASMDHRPEGQHRPTTHYKPPPDKTKTPKGDKSNPQVDLQLSLARDLEEAKRTLEKGFEKEREAGLREFLLQLKQTEAEEIDTAKDAAEKKRIVLAQSVAMGRASRAFELEELKKITADQAAMEIAAITKHQQSLAKGSLDFQKLEAQKVQIARKAANDIANYQTEKLKVQADAYQKLFGSITGRFNSAVTGMITSQQSLAQAVEQMEKQLLSGMASMALKTIENAAAKAGAAMIAAHAASGDWWGAIPAGAAAFAEAMSFQAFISSARGGFDIPAGMNPLTQLHEEEMVLPRELSNKVRNLTEDDRAGGRNSMGDEQGMERPKTTNHFNFHISAVDARGFEEMLHRNQGALVKVSKAIHRNGRMA